MTVYNSPPPYPAQGLGTVVVVGMTCSRFVLTKLVASARSIVAPFRGAAMATNIRRGFATTSIRDIYAEPMLGPMLRGVPHTLLYTTHLSTPGEEELCPNLLSLIKRNNQALKFSVHLPGNERMSLNKAGISICLDLGLDYHNDGTFDDQMVETKIISKNKAFFIKGYVQNDDTRNYYYARINLPDLTDELSDSIKTKIKDGFMNVTIPWQIEPATCL